MVNKTKVSDLDVEEVEKLDYNPYGGFPSFLTYTYSVLQHELASQLPAHDQKIGGYVDAGYTVVSRQDWKESVGDSVVYTSWVSLVRY